MREGDFYRFSIGTTEIHLLCPLRYHETSPYTYIYDVSIECGFYNCKSLFSRVQKFCILGFGIRIKKKL